MRFTVRRSLPKQFVVNSPVYPPAVHHSFLCQTEADRRVRAFSIVHGYMGEDTAGANFYDHAGDPLVLEAAERAGYRIGPPPHDVYLMYDVLDHVLDRHPSEVLREAGTLLSPNGRIYARLHPWCSRHGTHLYHQLNKAFLSVYLTRKDMSHMGLEERPTRRGFTRPLDEYRKWVRESGLTVDQETVHRSPLEKVFEQLRQRGELDSELYAHMDINFVDFQLVNSYA